MKFSDVTVEKAFSGLMTIENMKERLFNGAGLSSWASFSEAKAETYAICLKELARIRKYTPEQRYATFVIKEFVRFARAIKRAAFVESDTCIDTYAYDAIGVDSPMYKQLLTFPNENMKNVTIESLGLALAIDKLVEQILDEEYDALESLYYKAFPTDIELKDVKAENFNEEPEPLEEKPQKTTFVNSENGEKVKSKKINSLEDFLKMLGELAEEVDKAKKTTTTKPQTKQDIATDFINSATKTQKKNDKFGW